MSGVQPAQSIEWIPIQNIVVVNPRIRNRQVFQEIVDNISQIGLKRPITVTRRQSKTDPRYDLVCGQGRLEAYEALGQDQVPALVVAADAEDCLIASLVENCARRQHRAIDLLQDIADMQKRGHSLRAIARKTGLSNDYVHGVARLLSKGEKRLLIAVESHTLPLSVAIEIADTDDHGIQRALHEAYEKGTLRGKKLLAAKRVVEMRRRRGKSDGQGTHQPSGKVSSAALVRAYEEDADRKREMIRRANTTRDRLALIAEALTRLSTDEQFVALLEDSDLATMPEKIASLIDVRVEGAT